FQVKVRGHRIELGEIESVLEEDSRVTRAVAEVVGSGRLAAAVTSHGSTVDGLLEHVAARLPAYMVPERIVAVERLPLTANGKVDRDRLRQLLGVDPGTDAGSEEPRGSWERTLAGLWTELLGIPEIGRQHNFFALGGDSLLATRMAETLRRRFGIELSLRQVFGAPTVAELAARTAGGQDLQDVEFEEGVV
ncbi:phosphopantetheine-binding protein, partial [Amycolatopsis sp. NPDC004079]|uniref:phosphopantetheine-binding protein n=1 Tax=Amycolatopsis sp. NPDC004079 TaxID=3154549 RepID=UPI0033AE9D00